MPGPPLGTSVLFSSSLACAPFCSSSCASCCLFSVSWGAGVTSMESAKSAFTGSLSSYPPATTDPAGAGAAGASSAMAVTLRQEATTHAATTPDKNFFIFITCSPLSFLKRSGSSGKFFIFYSTTSFRKKQEQSALSCHFLPPFLPPQTDNFRPPVRRPPAYASPARTCAHALTNSSARYIILYN